MFDTYSRNDFKREQIRRAGNGPLPKRSPISLLSIGGDDPAERHRQARLRREAALAPAGEQPYISPNPTAAPSPGFQAAEKTSRPAGLLAGWTSRWTGKEGPKPSTRPHGDEFQATPTRAGEAGDFASGSTAASFQEADSQQWKPLIDPMKVIGGIAGSKMLIASATVIGLLVGVAIAVTTPKKYEAAAELLVDPRDLNLVSRDLTPTGLSNEATLAVVENQVRVLTSGSVLTKVVDRLNLENDPEFNGMGGSFGIGSVISELRSLLSRSDSAAGGDRRHTLAVRNLSESLRVERGGKTFVIVIGAVTKDREKSALIANTTTEVFLETYGQI
nr:succinoglycan biosynthesis protein exop [Pseudaminobacter sp.]